MPIDLLNTSSSPAGRTLARLSFWVPSEQAPEFARACEREIVPLLERRGLQAIDTYPRPEAPGVTSRLFVAESTAAVLTLQEELQHDPVWREALDRLGGHAPSSASSPGPPIRHSFGLFSTPAVPGSVVPAKEGRGHWRIYDATDGLADNMVYSIALDREGNLWFATECGACRYDGEGFVTFTRQDGLADDFVLSAFLDRDGDLWFGTVGGVSRMRDGTFTSFTTDDGLAHSVVGGIAQDRDGNLWFGSGYVAIEGGGVTRYDGSCLTAFTTDDGLPQGTIGTVLHDRDGFLWLPTWGGGVARFNGEHFDVFTSGDGLASNRSYSAYQDREGYIWFGTSSGVSRFDGTRFTTVGVAEGMPHQSVLSVLQDGEGDLWFATAGGVGRLDGNQITVFTTGDGLPAQVVVAALEDSEGSLWFGTVGGGVARYDGRAAMVLTTREGLASDSVAGLLCDREGAIWISTLDQGVIRYGAGPDGKLAFASLGSRDGLTHNTVRCMLLDQRGDLWLGTYGGAVNRISGSQVHTFGPEDGMPKSPTFAFMEDRRGRIWCGHQGGGVSCFDGERFLIFTTRDGLAHDDVRCLLEDEDGRIWCGTNGGGLSRYDGRWEALTTEDGLGSNRTQEGAIFQDRDRHIWIGTRGGGVSRYDGAQFATFTTDDGLAHNTVWCITQDRAGQIWVGTDGGVSRYDGRVWQTLTQDDGLPGNVVRSILIDAEESLWLGTNRGIFRYRPTPAIPPPVYVDSVTAGRRYDGVRDVTAQENAGLVVFEFHGVSFRTRADGMVYRYRLRGSDDDWANTRQRRVEYLALPVGDYTFEVEAVDRDLVYSQQAATVHLQVIPDPRDEQIDELEQRVRERTRELEETHRQLEQTQERLIYELEGELRTAHELQMGLMPRQSPQIPGFELAGCCVPATHVGGDFFQYFPHPDGRFSVALADVSGHAMQAAIPAVMFSGALNAEMRLAPPLGELFASLNTALSGSLDERTFVCFTMGELNPSSRVLRLSNGGCPHPYHYCAARGDVVELELNAYPLGVRPDTRYSIVEVQLQPGDQIIFCSDGIMEAMEPGGTMFGFGSTAEVIHSACREGLSAGKLVDRILSRVKEFSGDAPQADDQTVVVLRAEG